MQVNSINLVERVAIITGGAQGIGLAIAHRFLASGAKVILWDLQTDRLERARAELLSRANHGVVFTQTVDIADLAGVEGATRSVVEIHGRIDVLINNAALIGPNATLAAYPVEAWRDVINVDINGTFYCCRAIVPQMEAQNYGRIVNVASVAGKEGNPNASAYSAAKAAVIAMTKSLGKELARRNIAVNCITPAVARTEGAMQQAPAHIEYLLAKIPRGRFLELGEVAAMVAWLSSEENSFTTGAVFDLSGGRATY
jgi:3-oxoacyl-[acyl-carrier protein] reductase